MSDLSLTDGDDEEVPLPLSALLPTSTGRIISTKGLLERIIEQFRGEFDEARVIAATPVEQRTMVRDVTQYVLAVETVTLNLSEQARLIQQATSELLGFGGLDVLFEDEQITTIVIDGMDTLAVRYAPGSDLVSLPTVFDDQQHLRRIVDRLLLTAGVPRDTDSPIVETGLQLAGRHASLNVVLPPYVTQLRADIRLHPRVVPTLATWQERGYLDAKAAQVLRALVASPHGLMIVGDTESGKTTLLNIVAELLVESVVVSVERAGEMRLADEVATFGVAEPTAHSEGRDLAQGVQAALRSGSQVLLLDEVRADEPEAIAALLLEEAPRLIWSVRGTAEPLRIKSALTIIVQRACGGAAPMALDTLFDRLPFVVMLRRRRGTIQLIEIAEWQLVNDYIELVSLLRRHDDTYEATGKLPLHPLAVPNTLWQPD